MTAPATTVAPPNIELAGRRPAPVPERAAGIQLFGELPDSGYRHPPALARRADGQLIKLTRLLYQLVDAIDGRRGYEQLADELSRRIGKRATADDVRYLVEKKLRPLGVLRRSDGAQPAVKRSNPLLVLRPRIVVSNPKWTRRFATPFLWLFHPAIMASVLVAFALLTGWLLIDKGLASALHQAFYEPSLMLVVWALVVLSMAFHEFGHAAACRYGGAEPGVMGAGLYLAWPAFYTEVSDAYRLDRRGRLRVDLGGLYFNAIFSLAVAGVWALTHDDALLLVVAIQLLQIVRQLAPFIRADGYHIVADLIGVPDLFAHIKPTLLGLLPTRWGRPEHRTLKPWARGVVAIWVLTVVPLLLGFLGYIVLILPRLVATAWDSVGGHWAETTRFWGEGDVAGAVTSGLSTGLIALPILGIFVLLGRLGRRAALRTWRGTAGHPRLRALALVGAAGLAGVIAWAWWPGDQYQPIKRNEPAPGPVVLTPSSSEPATAQPWLVSMPLPAPGGVPVSSLIAEPPPMPVLQTLATLGEEARLLPSTRDSSPNGDAPTGPTPWGGTPDPQGTDPWPFPFDRPAPPGPDDNRAEAYNTANGSTLTDVATFLLLSLAGEPVDQANETDAWASCRSCRTVAVAFEVILIIGYVDEVAPTNTATALNYDCVDCSTSAFAYQLVLTLAEMPDGTALAQLAQILQGVGDLDLASLSDEDIYLALEEARREILDLLGGSVVTGVAGSLLTSHSGSSSTDVPSDTADPTDAGTTTTAPSDTTTTSAPTNTTTTSEPTTTTTTSDPTTATTSEPTTTTTSDPTTTTTTTTTEPTTTTTTTTTDNTSTSP